MVGFAFGGAPIRDRHSSSRDVDLTSYLGECRELVTAEIRRLFGGRSEHDEALYDLILDYPLREGKALRPTLAIATCRALGGYVESVLPTAATLELYHNAFLIHDDVEDESLMRRGRPTLHVEHGVPIAVNVGDSMLVLSLQPLLDNTAIIGLGPALRILSLIASMARESVEGQAIELSWVRANRWDLSDADYLDMVVQKTGWYSFIAPVQAGAIVAGAPPDHVEALTDFARELSIAFQITDDVLNLRGRPEDYGKEIGGDLWEGKRTLMLLHAVRHADPDQAERARHILGKARPGSSLPPTALPVLDDLHRRGELSDRALAELRSVLHGTGEAKTHAEVEWLFDLVEQRGSVEHAVGVARHHAEAAALALDRLDWLPGSPHRAVLAELVAYVHERSR